MGIQCVIGLDEKVMWIISADEGYLDRSIPQGK